MLLKFILFKHITIKEENARCCFKEFDAYLEIVRCTDRKDRDLGFRIFRSNLFEGSNQMRPSVGEFRGHNFLRTEGASMGIIQVVECDRHWM